MEERHAYEVIDEGCWIHAFFDLDAPAVTALDLENGSAAANRVVTAVVAALAELAALREPGRLPLEVDVLVLDATRPVGTEGACAAVTSSIQIVFFTCATCASSRAAPPNVTFPTCAT